MDLYSFIISNKEIFKALYAALIVLICLVIVLRSHKLFKLSSHPGIRYFRNAFFFFGLGFASRYFLKFFLDNSTLHPYSFIPIILFNFFVVMAGFFLLYSLIWKKVDNTSPRSSLFNTKISLFYLFALIIVMLDYLWNMYTLMFISQIIVFIFASSIGFANTRKKKNTTSNLFFVAMLLSLLAWVLNSLAVLFFEWNTVVIVNVYMLNTIFFLLFLYGVVKSTKN